MESEEIIEKIKKFFMKQKLDASSCYLLSQRLVSEYEDVALYGEAEAEETETEEEMDLSEETEDTEQQEDEEEPVMMKPKPKIKGKPQMMKQKPVRKEVELDDLDF